MSLHVKYDVFVNPFPPDAAACQAWLCIQIFTVVLLIPLFVSVNPDFVFLNTVVKRVHISAHDEVTTNNQSMQYLYVHFLSPHGVCAHLLR